MNKRQNLLSLLRRQGYEEVPVEFFMCPSLEEEYHRRHGHEQQYEDYFGFSWDKVDDLRLPEHDTEQYRHYFDPPLKSDGFIDLWGVGHEPSPNSAHMTHMRNPLKHVGSMRELEAYPFPDFEHADGHHQKEQADAIHARGLASVGFMPMTIWEIAWYLRGMEELMMDMAMKDPKALALFDRVTEIAIRRARSFAAAGVDLLFIGDDIGMQQSIMMSENMYKEWIWHRLKQVIEAAKAVKPDILVIYHSCGYIMPFIPSLIEAGVDVLNPIQTECISFEEVHRLYGQDLSFHGTIGTQTTMPHGTPEEVKKAVTDNLNIAGKKGGLYVAPTHMLEPEVPWENILAYVEACRSYKHENNA